VVISLWRHWNELPPDQFDALVLFHHPGGYHCFHLGDRKAPTRQTLSG
jgi:hypothetical protein